MKRKDNKTEIYPDHHILGTGQRLKIRTSILYNTVSFLGRLFYNRKPPQKNNEQNYLHLGCGLNHFKEFVNADFFVRFSWFKAPYFPDWKIDLNYPLKCDDNYWDGVFTEHTLEHLYPDSVLKLFKELCRTMKKDSIIRIAVPDLEKYVNYYTGKEEHPEFKKWDTGAEAIRNLSQNWGHISLWDFELIRKFLEMAGFRNIVKCGFREGVNSDLLKDKHEHRFETLYVEAQK